MREFVFVNPTHSYDSYTDYRKLVSSSGFEVCHQDQMEANRNVTYIVSPLNGDVHAALDARPKDKRTCKVIWWFLERPGPHGGANFPHVLRDHLRLVNEIWLSDRSMWNKVRDIPEVKFVPVGGDESLGTLEKRPKLYDITHMSYVYGRRDKIIHPLKCRIGPNGWGEQRNDTLIRSNFMVNTHQDEDQYFEPLRFALCASYALPMITEACADPYPYIDGIDFVGAPFNALVGVINQMVKDGPDKYRAYGERMWLKATKQFRFKDIVKGMASQ